MNRISIAFFFSFIAVALCQPVPPNAPPDKPAKATSQNLSQFEKDIAPYIAKGRKTFPEAKKRYLAGLPARHTFFVTVRLTDSTGKFEVVFLRVRGIDETQRLVIGRISNKIDIVKGYSLGQVLTLPESEILDWTISRPDGTEEGNVLGNFLDTYRPPKRANQALEPTTPRATNFAEPEFAPAKVVAHL